MQDKVKLPREVAEAIEETKRRPLGVDLLHDIEYMRDVYKNDKPDVALLAPIYLYYRGNTQNYFKALVNGYEVEQSPEENVRDLYNGWNEFDGPDGIYSSQTIASIIVDVLDHLNIKIEGVNA